MTPDRAATVARVVQVAIAATRTTQAARRALHQWAGHPADPNMKDDAIELLDRVEREARQEAAK